jgi:DNA-binding MarR family transcriptional regulator
VGFLLSQLGYATSRGFRETLAPLGLEPRQFAMLRFVGLEEGRSQQAIGDALQIPASRMVALVDDLEQRGLVERRLDPADRRTRSLHLTPKGRRLLSKAWELAVQSEARTCAGLSKAQREQLLGLLRKVAGNYELHVAVHPELTEERPGWGQPGSR